MHVWNGTYTTEMGCASVKRMWIDVQRVQNLRGRQFTYEMGHTHEQRVMQ